jgi:polysaccharide pyruvyl transferase WcaK-like protein
MNILIASGTNNCANLGDVAMLQTAVLRLRGQWPEAIIDVLTDTPERLAAFCPEASACPARPLQLWAGELSLLGKYHRRLPSAAARPVEAGHHLVKERWPELLRAGLTARAELRRQSTSEMRRFWKVVDAADLFVVCGAGGFGDHSREWNEQILDLLALGEKRERPVVMFGQGFGPLSDREIIAKARRRFAAVKRFTLRESLYGPDFLKTLGVQPDRIHVTGDEAIEAAWQETPRSLGRALGVNLRVSRSSAVLPESAALVAAVLWSMAVKYNCPLTPVPIDPSDRITFESLFFSTGEIATPLDCMRAAGHCRVIVTGAYHAAVFALSQGVPAVCLVGSGYFESKFRGLSNQFGRACGIVPLQPQASLTERVRVAIESAWANADYTREPLLQAAADQIRLQRAAYTEFAMAVGQHPDCAAAGAGRSS